MVSVADKTDNDRPTTPTEDDCCGNGCDPCIFDVHRKLLEEWKKRKEDQIKVPPDKNYLSSIKYHKFITQNVIKASEDSIFVQLECGSEIKNNAVIMNPGQHIMIKLGAVTKPYTPIAWNQTNIRLLVKLYQNGEASNYFRELKTNDELLVRGPYGEFKYQRNSYKNIIMLGIGSGIAAIYPIANSIIQDQLEDTKIKMFLGFRSLSHLPLKNELRLLTDYWNFECSVYLSQEYTHSMAGIKVINHRLNEEIISEILNSYLPESTLILICGTSEFNETAEKIVTDKTFLHYHVFR